MATFNRVEIRLLEDSYVDVGFVYDIRRGEKSLVSGVNKEYVNANSTDHEFRFSESILLASSDSASKSMDSAGHLEINVPLSAASINGSADLGIKTKNSHESVSRSLRSYSVESAKTLNIDNLKPDNFHVRLKSFTHVVTSVMYGKFMFGDLTLESKTDSTNVDVRGDLTVQIQKIPISGSGNISVKVNEISDNYNFSSSVTMKG
jgi:hypothetical protein